MSLEDHDGASRWYNTRCPVYDARIDWQRNKLLAAVRAGAISFKDINDEPDVLASYGASVDDVRRRLGCSPGTNGRSTGDADDRLFLRDCYPNVFSVAIRHPRAAMKPMSRSKPEMSSKAIFPLTRPAGDNAGGNLK